MSRDAARGLYDNSNNKVLKIYRRILRLFVNFSQLTMISVVVCVNSSFLYIVIHLIFPSCYVRNSYCSRRFSLLLLRHAGTILLVASQSISCYNVAHETWYGQIGPPKTFPLYN